jgi:hypothetical protein
VRVQRIARALGKLTAPRGGATAWEVWQSLFPQADPVTQMRTRMLMVIGGLDVLEDEGGSSLAAATTGSSSMPPA